MALGAFSEESQVDRIFPPEHGTSHELVRQNPRAHKTFPCNSPALEGRSAVLLALFYSAERGGSLCGLDHRPRGQFGLAEMVWSRPRKAGRAPSFKRRSSRRVQDARVWGPR